MRRLASALSPAVHESEFASRLDDTVINMRRLPAECLELVAELAHIGDANASTAREPHVDLARGAERECSVRKIADVSFCRARGEFGLAALSWP